MIEMSILMQEQQIMYTLVPTTQDLIIQLGKTVTH